jgi:hypothetical protein
MKRFLCLGLALLLFPGGARAADSPVWNVASPDHRQTFAYGSERHRQWVLLGNHLGVVMEFTNDPYVDTTQPRQYDDFTFEFPKVKLGKDGHTFYYTVGNDKSIAVAVRHSSFFGDEISLLSSDRLVIQKFHGLLSLNLLVTNSNSASGPNVGEM